MTIVTSKGQVTLPKRIRDALGLVPGTSVEFSLEPGRVVLRKRASADPFQEWEGFLRGKLPAASADEFIEIVRGERPRPPIEVDEDRG